MSGKRQSQTKHGDVINRCVCAKLYRVFTAKISADTQIKVADMLFSSFHTLANSLLEPFKEKLQDSITHPFTALKPWPNVDQILHEADRALKVLTVKPYSKRPYPGLNTNDPAKTFTPETRKHVAGLMRINHTGEICAQALYFGQAFGTTNPHNKTLFVHAAQEESDHLAWTAERLESLHAKPSLLNPLWYVGSFGLGALASRLSDQISLDFMAETEHQVENHLNSHLEKLPEQDDTSKAIITQMKIDEIKHGQTAILHGASQLPVFIRHSMATMAKLMKTIAYRI